MLLLLKSVSKFYSNYNGGLMVFKVLLKIGFIYLNYLVRINLIQLPKFFIKELEMMFPIW